MTAQIRQNPARQIFVLEIERAPHAILPIFSEVHAHGVRIVDRIATVGRELRIRVGVTFPVGGKVNGILPNADGSPLGRRQILSAEKRDERGWEQAGAAHES